MTKIFLDILKKVISHNGQTCKHLVCLDILNIMEQYGHNIDKELVKSISDSNDEITNKILDRFIEEENKKRKEWEENNERIKAHLKSIPNLPSIGCAVSDEELDAAMNHGMKYMDAMNGVAITDDYIDEELKEAICKPLREQFAISEELEKARLIPNEELDAAMDHGLRNMVVQTPEEKEMWDKAFAQELKDQCEQKLHLVPKFKSGDKAWSPFRLIVSSENPETKWEIEEVEIIEIHKISDSKWDMSRGVTYKTRKVTEDVDLKEKISIVHQDSLFATKEEAEKFEL